MIDRREFITDATRMVAGVAVGAAGASRGRAEDKKAVSRNGVAAAIPMPLQVVIDDVGWWSGEDGSERQEPYRTGIDRRHGFGPTEGHSVSMAGLLRSRGVIYINTPFSSMADAVAIATSSSLQAGDEILHTLRLERRPGLERARARVRFAPTPG